MIIFSKEWYTSSIFIDDVRVDFLFLLLLRSLFSFILVRVFGYCNSYSTIK
jgi:hypothetical protein